MHQIIRCWRQLGLPLDPVAFQRWQAIDAQASLQELVLECYRDASDPLKILIVTAKLLTGFDAPICYCMYLDKPIRDQALPQAMCRTNRLYGASKQHGLIIDYLGFFENLAKALAYDPEEINTTCEAPQESHPLPRLANNLKRRERNQTSPAQNPTQIPTPQRHRAIR